MIQPVRRLRGVRHIDVPACAPLTVEVVVNANDLAHGHGALRTFADTGECDVWIAPSSTGAQLALL